ncbi:hypothetical protein BV210_03080 [Halorientalis sp. IM1011]|uniref:hypothetical protein n=1 Tax=Halorientalis sp. IM1011 TaxID=1932360 RepID=UPI00097CCC13|nr:hypothetical protein [Halorientalis sp. IM1011]AQL41762.1 hypothetical protein BV210_03080 [Halorientalis sp. IM1011]
MDFGSYVPYVAAAVILVGTLASGPLALADRPTDRTPEIGTGSVEVGEVTLPATAALRQGQFGEDSYYLQVPDATVRFDGIEGRPILTYKIEIPALSYSRESAFFLGPDTGDRMELSLERDQLAPDRVQNDSYAGVVRVVDRTDEESRFVAERNITVEVRR